MRKQRGRIENGKLVLVDWAKNRLNPEYQTWYCKAFYAQFKDGVHQREIWFRDGETTHRICDLISADLYSMDCVYAIEGWNEGFYYGHNMRHSHQHLCVAFCKGVGDERQVCIRRIEIEE